MDDKETMLKQLGLKTMFAISDEEMPALKEEYDIFMSHVAVLEKIDTTDVEPLAYPYEIETTYLRKDDPSDTITTQEALQNAKNVQENQIKVPKVVG